MQCYNCGREFSGTPLFDTTCPACKQQELQTKLLQEQTQILREGQFRQQMERMERAAAAQQADRMANPEKWAEIDRQSALDSQRAAEETFREYKANGPVLFFGSLLLLWVGIVVVRYWGGTSEDVLLVTLAGWLGIVFFGLCVLYYGYQVMLFWKGNGALMIVVALIASGIGARYLRSPTSQHIQTQTPPTTNIQEKPQQQPSTTQVVPATVQEQPKVIATPQVPTLVVSKSGQSDYASISEAIKNAKSGDRIVVRPGTYQEPRLLIDKRVEVIGEGTREEIVVEVPNESTSLSFDTESASVRGIRFRATTTTTSIIYVYKGSHVIADCEVDASNGSRNGSIPVCVPIYINGDPTAYLQIKSCNVTGGSSGVRYDNGHGFSVERSTISRNQFGILLMGSGEVKVQNCTITGNQTGVFATPTARATVQNCDLRGNSLLPFRIQSGAQVELIDNMR